VETPPPHIDTKANKKKATRLQETSIAFGSFLGGSYQCVHANTKECQCECEYTAAQDGNANVLTATSQKFGVSDNTGATHRMLNEYESRRSNTTHTGERNLTPRAHDILCVFGCPNESLGKEPRYKIEYAQSEDHIWKEEACTGEVNHRREITEGTADG